MVSLVHLSKLIVVFFVAEKIKSGKVYRSAVFDCGSENWIFFLQVLLSSPNTVP